MVKEPATFVKPRDITVFNSNVNGDGEPKGLGHWDVLCLQELHKEQLKQIQSLFPKRVLYTPYNKHLNLGIMLNLKVAEVTGKGRTYVAHPSGDDMRKDSKWYYKDKPIPDKLVTPVRGVFELPVNWFGRADMPGLIRVGHRVNRGPNQLVRNWLGKKFDDLVTERNKATKDLLTLEFYDFNEQHPKPFPNMEWLFGHSTDHVGGSLNKFETVGPMKKCAPVGHSGRVHHKPIGNKLKFVLK